VSAQGYVSARIVLQSKKEERYPAYIGMSAKITFLGQLQLKLAVSVGKLPMLAHQIMEHIGTCVVHALQKVYDLKGYEKSLAGHMQKFMLFEIWHRCCAPIPALGDWDLKLRLSSHVGQLI
jgi:hypothetical protein